ncbi:MAG: hypothetical protein HRU42_03340 [Shewanella sp.]|nr:hypothetical protein [Shewanella sp.]
MHNGVLIRTINQSRQFTRGTSFDRDHTIYDCYDGVNIDLSNNDHIDLDEEFDQAPSLLTRPILWPDGTETIESDYPHATSLACPPAHCINITMGKGDIITNPSPIKLDTNTIPYKYLVSSDTYSEWYNHAGYLQCYICEKISTNAANKHQ